MQSYNIDKILTSQSGIKIVEGGSSMKVEHDLFTRVLSLLSLFLIIGTTIALIVLWKRIPEEIPMHYNALGEIDRYDHKSGLIMIQFFSWLSYGSVVLAERIPQLWNTGVSVTNENQDAVYRTVKHLIVVTKFLVVLTFSWINLMAMISHPLGSWFMPVDLKLIFGSFIWSIVKLHRLQ